MQIQFFFEFSSTYSYLAAARIGAVAQAADVEVVWEPFLLGPIFQARGWSDSPFNLDPEKGRYMWRDVERLCEKYSLPFRRPSTFPRNGLLAARIACVGRGQTWLPDFTRAVFHAAFADDRDISDRDLLTDIVASLELDPESLFTRAESAKNKQALREQVERARGHEIFGAPSFVVGEELFWGNDRLGDAIAWARIGAPSS